MADSSESRRCEVPDCRLIEYQTTHKSHTSTHGGESQSESENGPPDPDSQTHSLVLRPGTGDPRQTSEWKCEVMGCEFSTPTEADLNQKIKVMELHTRQAHPMTPKAISGPRLVLALAVVIALLAVGFGIKETRDSRIAKEAWMKAMEVETNEAKDAKKRTDKKARDAKERAEKETHEAKEMAEKEAQEAKKRGDEESQAAKERAEKEMQEAKDRAEKESQAAKEKEAQEKKDNVIRQKLKFDFENFRNQDPGTHSSLTVQELQFLDLKELHRCKFIEDVDADKYDSTVENLADLMQFNDAQKKEMMLAKYSKSLVNVVEDFKYAEIGIYTYGKYQTLRRPNGNVDITFAMHAFRWDINQDKLDTKGNSDISDKPDRDVAKLKSGAKLKESERKAWKSAFRAEVIGLFQKDCPPHLLSEIGLQEKERKDGEKHKHEKVVNNLENEIKNMKEEEAKKQKENDNLKRKLDAKWF